MVFQNFRTLDLIFPFDWNFFFNIVSVKSEPYGGNYLTKKYYSHFRVVSFIQLLKRTERGFIFITSIYKEIITTEEQSPFEQTRENSSVLTAHTHQEGEHAVLVLSRVPVSYQMFAGDPNWAQFSWPRFNPFGSHCNIRSQICKLSKGKQFQLHWCSCSNTIEWKRSWRGWRV